MNYALERARKKVGGDIPPVSSRYAVSTSHLRSSGAARGHSSADSVPSTPSSPRYRLSMHGHRRDRSR